MSTTGKTTKTVFKGVRTLRDEETGELIETQVVERRIEDADAGFHKVWLGHILELVSEVGNAKMKVLMWLLKKADANNQIAASLREIAKETGTSVATTQRLMNALLEANVLVRNGRYGLWRLNPDVVFQGSHRGRMNVLVSYRDERQRELFDTAGPQLRRVA